MHNCQACQPLAMDKKFSLLRKCLLKRLFSALNKPPQIKIQTNPKEHYHWVDRVKNKVQGFGLCK